MFNLRSVQTNIKHYHSLFFARIKMIRAWIGKILIFALRLVFPAVRRNYITIEKSDLQLANHSTWIIVISVAKAVTVKLKTSLYHCIQTIGFRISMWFGQLLHVHTHTYIHTLTHYLSFSLKHTHTHTFYIIDASRLYKYYIYIYVYNTCHIFVVLFLSSIY